MNAMLLIGKISLLLGLGWLLNATFTGCNPRWRVLAWRLVAVGALVLPLVTAIAPAWRVLPPRIEPLASTAPNLSILPAVDLPQTATAPSQRHAVSNPTLDHNLSAPVHSAPPEADRSIVAFFKHNIAIVALAAWLSVAALLVARWLTGRRILRKLLREAEPASEDMIAASYRIAADLSCRPAEVRLSPRIPTPCLLGWRRPVLLLPARMAGDDYRRELPAIIAHEYSHLRGGDCLWLQILHLVSVAWWFHPLAWRIGRAHTAACEEVSDAMTAAYLGDTASYTRTLVRVAAELSELPVPREGIAMARSPHIMRRLRLLRARVMAAPIPACHAMIFTATFVSALLALGAASAAPEEFENARAYDAPLPAGAAMRLGGQMFQQPSAITALALSPDGHTVATGGFGNEYVRLWNLKTGEKLKELAGLRSTFILAFSPDGKILAAGGDASDFDGNTLILYAIPSGEVLHKIAPKQVDEQRFERRMEAMAFSPDGRQLLTGAADGIVRLWDVATGVEREHWIWFDRYIDAVAWSPDGGRIAAANNRGELCILEFGASKEPIKIKAAAGEVNALRFTPDGKFLISGGDSYHVKTGPRTGRSYGSVKIWDAATGNPVRELESTEKDPQVAAFAMAPDGKILAVGYIDKTIRFWDVQAGKEVRKLQGTIDRRVGKYGLAFTPDGKHLVGGGQGNVIGVWDLASGNRLYRDADTHSGEVRSMVFSPDSRTLYTGSVDQTVRAWDLTTRRGRTLMNAAGWVDSIAISDDGRLLAAVSPLSAVCVWDVSANKQVLKIDASREKEERFAVAAFSPKGDLIAVGYGNDDPRPNDQPYPVRMWNLKTGKPAGELTGHALGVDSINFSPDGKTVSTISGDGVIRRWDIENKTELVKLETGEHFQMPVSSTIIASDSAICAYIPAPKTVKTRTAGGGFGVSSMPSPITVMDLPDEPVASPSELSFRVLGIRDQTPWFSRMAFTRDHRRLFASTIKNQVYEWDTASGKLAGSIEISTEGNRIGSIAAPPDGNMLATGMADGTILIWPREIFK